MTVHALARGTRGPMGKKAPRTRIGIVLSVALCGLGLLAPTAQAAPSSLVDATASTKRAVIAAINDELGEYRPARCFKIRVAKSNRGWATWYWSNYANTQPYGVCRPFDGFPDFYKRTGRSTFVYAGDVKPAWTTRTTCRFLIAPPARVARDFGCDRWSVRP